MITVIEYHDGYEFNLHTAFCEKSSSIAKEHFDDALENSSTDYQYPYIAVTIYSDNGKSYIDGNTFKTAASALEWWEVNANLN